MLWANKTKLLLIALVILPFHSMAELSGDLKLGLQAYFNGDFILAHEHLSLSAESNNGDAQYLLGHMFENGKGVEVDEQQSFRWYLASAKNGIPPSQYSVSLRYSSGIGTKKDVQKGLFWLEAAARQGHDFAQFKLGLDLIENGKTKKGLIWLRIASLAGVSDARKAYSQFAQEYSQRQHEVILKAASRCIRSSYNDCTT